MPLFNGSRFLESALSSIFSQTLCPREILLVDDASTDDSLVVAERIARTSPVPVRILRLPANTGGPATPMNVGIENAQGDLIALLDQDDLMKPHRLQLQADFLLRNPDCPAVIGLLEKIDAQDQPLAPTFPAESSARIRALTNQSRPGGYALEAASVYRHVLSEGTLTIASSTVLRRSAWQALGGFDTRFRIAWDLECSARLTSLGPLGYIDEVLGAYRLHGNNTSAGGFRSLLEITQLRDEHRAKPLFPLPDQPLRRLLADGHSSLGYHWGAQRKLSQSLHHWARAIRAGASPLGCLMGASKSVLKSLVPGSGAGQ